MKEKWNLKTTNNINQILRIRNDLDIEAVTKKESSLLLINHNFHVADDTMFPDPSCLSFFKAFEEKRLFALENEHKLTLLAVNICEGVFSFYVYCKEPQNILAECIDFLKSSVIYKCDFEIIMNDNGEKLKALI